MYKNNYIKGLLSHDEKVLNAIYINFSERIQKYVLRHGGTVDDAKDVFQDSLMVVYKKAQSPDFELTSQFYTFFFSICKFTWQRKKKKRSNNTVTIPTDRELSNSDDIEKDIIQREQHNLYRQNFAKLGKFCQSLLLLFYKKTSMIEIAEKLELKNDHVARTRKYRCQKKLEGLIKIDKRYAELIEKS